MARRSRDGEVCRRTAAAARQRPLHTPKPCGKLSVRKHLSGASRQLPSRGAFPLRQRASKPLLEERWHGGAVTERCAAAQRRRRVSALCTRRNPAGSLRCGNTSPAELDGEFYGASPLGISACADIPRILQSVSLRHASSPRGEPALSGDALLSLPLRGGGTPEGRDGEVCRRVAAAARKRPLHTPRPCGNLSVR